jgi:pimeloyl-ACP methyl ester carboxylesterase
MSVGPVDSRHQSWQSLSDERWHPRRSIRTRLSRNGSTRHLPPGIIAPAAIRYGPLVGRLANLNVLVRDLAVYDTNEAPTDFSIATELDALDRAADAAGFKRFHLYGHSGGGAVALGYAAARGDRLTSLAVDEPASDFTPEGNEVYGWPEFDKALTLPPAEAMNAHATAGRPGRTAARAARRAAAGVDAMRPAGIRAFVAAIREHRIAPDDTARFTAPVYFSRGSRTHPRWAAMQERLSPLFPDFTAEVFDGLHHLNTSHQAEPDRVALALLNFWERAEGLALAG